MRSAAFSMMMVLLVGGAALPASAQDVPLPSQAQVEAIEDDLYMDLEEAVDPYAEEEFEDEPGDFDLDENGLPPALGEDPNPLNPLGNSLETLVFFQFSDDLWAGMLGELPCLDLSEACIRELQDLAIANDPTLAEIEWRIEEINERIEQARAANQRRLTFSAFEPLMENLVRLDPVTRVPNPDNPPIPGSVVVPERRGFLEKVLTIFVEPLGGINEILSLVGLPLFRGVTGGGDAAQQRSIAIADLQIKVAEVERNRAEMARTLRQQVMLEVLAFDETRRQFQISQEIARREYTRTQLLRIDYQFGEGNTQSYLRDLSGVDRQRAATYTEWARLVTQLTKVKLLVVGDGGF